MLNNDCKVCRKEVTIARVNIGSGIECMKCRDRFCSPCVGLPKQVPRSLRNPGMFFFCDICRQVVLKFLDNDSNVARVDDSNVARVDGKTSTVNRVARVDKASSVNRVARVKVDIGNVNNVENDVSSIENDFIGFEIDTVGTTNSVQSSNNVDSNLSRKNVDNLSSENVDNDSGWTLVNGNRARKNRNLIVNRKAGNSVADVNRIGKKYVSTKNRSKESQNVYIAGDSIVAYQGQNLRNRLGNSVTASCIRGGKIEDVSCAVSESGKSNNIVISVGTNDIGKLGYSAIVDKYTDLFNKLRLKKCNVVIVGILPRLKESALWSSRAIAVNNFLQQQCILYNFKYIDLWEVMYKNRFYYNRDGIHLNFRGRNFLSDVIVNKLSESINFFR